MRRRVPLEERLWTRVKVGPGCWLWTGSLQRSGHGQIWFDGTMRLAHREAWRFFHGEIPEGLCVCHSCDNPPCMNPEHLWLGTQDDNIRDRNSKGRQARGETAGAARLTAKQVAEIRAALPYYGVGADLARRFGVSQANISHIRTGRNWRPLNAR